MASKKAAPKSKIGKGGKMSNGGRGILASLMAKFGRKAGIKGASSVGGGG